jgi:hypothetical protein
MIMPPPKTQLELTAFLADKQAKQQLRTAPGTSTSKQAVLAAVRLQADAYAASLGYRVKMSCMTLEPLE